MKLTMSQYQWQLPEHDHQFVKNLNQLREAGLPYSPAFLRILAHRGFHSREAVEKATNQTPQLFHDPFLLKDMSVAVERLHQAIAHGEKILIYGDYDADGITSALILYESLEQLGADVHYYLPNRFKDGYGPNLHRYQEFIESGIQLILTCDNGVKGCEAIEFARSQGVDVIVTDHHEIPDQLPDAYAIIHPAHPDGDYPFQYLSGAGVALKLATALMDEVPIEAIELAMIGTIADMVDLGDENRTIVLSGLNLMKETQRIGLQTMLDTQGVSRDDINEDTIGFIIAPRLNAIGRLGDASPGFELLKTFDGEEAKRLVEFVEKKNQQRKDKVNQIYQEILDKLEGYDNLPDIIIEAGEEWHAGILGIVASRISREFHRPVILCQYLASERLYKGSSRSIKGINIFDCIANQESYLQSFGGHEQAAGLTIEEQQWSSFKKAMFQEIVKFRNIFTQDPQLQIDVTVSIEELTLEFMEEIKLLGPYGTGNPKIIVHIEDATVQSIKYLGKTKDHLKLLLQQDDHRLPVIAFSQANRYPELQEESVISIIGYLDINRWNNQVNLQFLLEDIGMKGRQWIDLRGSQLPSKIFDINQATYLFNNKQWMRKLSDKLPEDAEIITYDDRDKIENVQNLVIMQPPKELHALQSVLEKYSWEKIYLGSYVHNSRYLQGLPQIEEIRYFYIWLLKQPAFEIRPNIQMISNKLNIPILKLKTMIMMFSEAKFVTIKSGWIQTNSIDTNEKIDLLQLPTYIAYKKAMEVEAILNFKPLSEVKAYFEREENS